MSFSWLRFWVGFGIFAQGATAVEIRWTMLNVTPNQSQADCHVLQMPDGRTVLIDPADADDAPGTAVALLARLGIRHVDLLVISHFHRDHYGRLHDLLRAGIQIDQVVLSIPDPTAAERERPWGCDIAKVNAAVAELLERRIPCNIPRAGDRIFEILDSCGNRTVSIDVLCCFDGLHTPIGATDVNDTSIVLRVTIGATRALMTGDLNFPMGSYLAESDVDLKADILKAPHHGTESTVPDAFYARVAPSAVLVPSPKGLWESARSMRARNYFRDRQVPTYVSGIHGNVTVHLRPDGYTIETER